MAAYGGRPHWAKVFHFAGDADFERAYPRWHEWKALRASVDPTGLFVNDWAARVLGLKQPAAGVGARRSPAAGKRLSAGSAASNGHASATGSAGGDSSGGPRHGRAHTFDDDDATSPTAAMAAVARAPLLPATATL
jgi:hypothetical protein